MRFKPGMRRFFDPSKKGLIFRGELYARRGSIYVLKRDFGHRAHPTCDERFGPFVAVPEKWLIDDENGLKAEFAR